MLSRYGSPSTCRGIANTETVTACTSDTTSSAINRVLGVFAVGGQNGINSVRKRDVSESGWGPEPQIIGIHSFAYLLIQSIFNEDQTVPR